MGEWIANTQKDRIFVPASETLAAVRALQTLGATDYSFDHNAAYGRYFRIQKVLVGEKGAQELVKIANQLEGSTHPNFLSVAGSAYLEAALCWQSQTAEYRHHLVDRAEAAWRQAMEEQATNPVFHPEYELTEHSDLYRTARDIAFTPLARAIIDGDVSEKVREQVFADVLSIAEQAVVAQRQASQETTEMERSLILSDFSGFLHECNCLLAFLYRNDPQRVPFPSTSRAGSGLEYVKDTHDIMLIHQKWGTIHRATPIEVKGSGQSREYSRYNALIVRGKSHLLPQDFGHHRPEILIQALSDVYNSEAPSSRSLRVAEETAAVVERLLIEYQKHERLALERRTPTHFHVPNQLGRYATRGDLLRTA